MKKMQNLCAPLRQCDGERLQCILLLRDDFWMAATRFMHQLEVRLVEGENSAAVDLFSPPHAKKVLAAFGAAFGDLPEDRKEITPEQAAFLDHAVNSLSENGKVICVRLALFAEMIKGRPWNTKTLADVGGMSGVGVSFLEETFAASTAPPVHRYHGKAARAVLKALLPDASAQIKGHMQSRQELLEASGYSSRPTDFEELMQLLDNELRLITPSGPGRHRTRRPRRSVSRVGHSIS